MAVKRASQSSFLAYIAELHRAAHAVGLFLDARIGGEVSQPEALVIMHLSGHSTSTINDLHHAFLHRRSTLTSVLDRLESKGLVERGSAGTDRRSVTVDLTARGGRVAIAIARAFDELRAEIESADTVSERDVTRLRNVAAQAARMASSRDG
jgi:DNA-binding MarR family transcriptional regulator